MPIKERRPLTPGQRGMSFIDFKEVTKKEPERSLLAPGGCHEFGDEFYKGSQPKNVASYDNG